MTPRRDQAVAAAEFMTVYGSDGDNPGQQVRDFHTQIKGSMPDGKRYHALDPDTYFWRTPRSSSRCCTSPTPSSSG